MRKLKEQHPRRYWVLVIILIAVLVGLRVSRSCRRTQEVVYVQPDGRSDTVVYHGSRRSIRMQRQMDKAAMEHAPIYGDTPIVMVTGR